MGVISGLLSAGLPAGTGTARGVMFFRGVIALGVLAAFVGSALNFRQDTGSTCS